MLSEAKHLSEATHLALPLRVNSATHARFSVLTALLVSFASTLTLALTLVVLPPVHASEFAGIFAGGVVGGGTGGFVQGAGYTLAYGGTLSQAFSAGLEGAWRGAAIGAATAPFAYAFQQVAKATAKFIPQQGDPNVFGVQTDKLTGNFFEDFLKAGGPLSKVMHYVPGAASVARFHDTTFNLTLGQPGFWATNIATMPHAIGITSGAVLHQAPFAPLVVDYGK